MIKLLFFFFFLRFNFGPNPLFWWTVEREQLENYMSYSESEEQNYFSEELHGLSLFKHVEDCLKEGIQVPIKTFKILSYIIE